MAPDPPLTLKLKFNYNVITVLHGHGIIIKIEETIMRLGIN